MKSKTKISKVPLNFFNTFPFDYKEFKYDFLYFKFKLLFIFLFPFFTQAQTDAKIDLDSLPSTIKNDLAKEYKMFNINLITKDTDDKDSITYSIELQKKNTMISLIYDGRGKLLSKEKSKVFTYDDSEKPKSAPKKRNDDHNHQH